jgi:transcriptional regulator with XRE-family HTH domain
MPIPLISAAQIRAARGLLGWSQADLATKAKVSRSTVAILERINRSTEREEGRRRRSSVTTEQFLKVRTAFEEQQIEFLPQEGVRVRSSSIIDDATEGANRRLLKDIIEVSLAYMNTTENNEILIYGLKEDDSESSVGEYLDKHITLLKQLGLEEKILCVPDNRKFVAPDAWYRYLPADGQYNHFPPVHVYGEKLAVVQWHPHERVVIVENKPIANAFRSMFFEVWSNAKDIRS